MNKLVLPLDDLLAVSKCRVIVTAMHRTNSSLQKCSRSCRCCWNSNILLL